MCKAATSTTEERNDKTMNLDEMSTHDILQIMNQEDESVTKSVNKEIIQIEEAVSMVIDSFTKGGRLIYIGAGTSGRLGILDAVECPPTFGTDPDKVRGLIAGGKDAIMKAVEGAEDDPQLAKTDLRDLHLTEKDMVIGLAASGQTPYVIGGLEYSSKIGARTASISCNKNALCSRYADTPIEIEVGPEILTGSTRLKAGTAQKLAVNMISTSAMIGIGKVYKNLMVDVQLTNQKLIERAKNIISLAAEVEYDTASAYLEKSHQNPKAAIIMIKGQCSYEQAKHYLEQADGFVRESIKIATDKDGETFG
ncbi:N-acetylmuramic acid 6-phosphate etherase [Salibacterium halotolerans]|uniref:N-acetylmuramic acid 6-phosphate etherase n=1 Tax=Salibacterium halotolerans TaxID=1884432 RepID=A0A1I5PBD6_9BACI|nr:N-acetylmuramic acid 6-phosphate etherase [Salibacterium halotolerans]SFP31217.1 N-acetylmuramic acid 6-phosphate etherase [Salibacterium halotolerans]